MESIVAALRMEFSELKKKTYFTNRISSSPNRPLVMPD